MGKLVGGGLHPAPQDFVPSACRGELDTLDRTELLKDLHRVLLPGVGEVEDLGRVSFTWQGTISPEQPEDLRNREAGDAQFVLRDTGGLHDFGSDPVRYKEEIRVAAVPEGVDGDRVGDHRDRAERAAHLSVKMIEEVVVAGVGGGDDRGVLLRDGPGQKACRPLVDGDATGCLLVLVEMLVKGSPESRKVIDDQKVGFLGQGVERAVSLREEIPDLHRPLRIGGLEGCRQISGRGVVALAEGGRENEDRSFHGLVGRKGD